MADQWDRGLLEVWLHECTDVGAHNGILLALEGFQEGAVKVARSQRNRRLRFLGMAILPVCTARSPRRTKPKAARGSRLYDKR